MTEQGIAFLLGGIFFTMVVAVGLIVRKVPLGGAVIIDRDRDPRFYWAVATVSALFAATCWYWLLTSA